MRIGYYNDLTGKRFGRLTVEKFSEKRNGIAWWTVRCDCDIQKEVRGYTLTSGHNKSCGCGHSDYMKTALGKSKGQLSGTHWFRIKSNAEARNIEVTLSQQEASELFEKQKGICALSGELLAMDSDATSRTASLDRINSNKGYEVGNVQWVHKNINLMKNQLDEKEFLSWVNKIANYKK